MVKIPIKIAADGNKSRSNVTSFEIKGISHFDNNIEKVLETFMELNERVIKPKCLTDCKEECKTVIKLVQLEQPRRLSRKQPEWRGLESPTPF